VGRNGHRLTAEELELIAPCPHPPTMRWVLPIAVSVSEYGRRTLTSNFACMRYG
jgi:hypothetical protein